MKKEPTTKVVANLRITQEQKDKITDLAKENGNTYSDMFRIIITLGIQAFIGRGKD